MNKNIKIPGSSNEQLQAARNEAISADKCFSKERLRTEFRMKPRSDADPVKFFKSAYGRQFGIYRIADCVPIRDKASIQISQKQLRARAILALKAKLRSRQAMASGVALQILAADAVYLDTETTGLGPDAQIIEIAIIEASGNVLFESRLRPSVPIDPNAFSVHGIDEEALANAPTWPEVANQVQSFLRGRTVVIFNSEFDVRMLNQTALAFSVPIDWWQDVNVRCAMYLAAEVFGATNRYGTISLKNATLSAGVEWPGRAHSAAVDALVTARLIKAIAALRVALDQELSNLLKVDEVIAP